MIMVTCLISMLVLTVLYILYFIMVEVIVMNDNTASAKEEVEVSDIERGGGKPFTRLRRITGYLADASSFNNGKRAELKDRVKHASAECGCGCR